MADDKKECGKLVAVDSFLCGEALSKPFAKEYGEEHFAACRSCALYILASIDARLGKDEPERRDFSLRVFLRSTAMQYGTSRERALADAADRFELTWADVDAEKSL